MKSVLESARLLKDELIEIRRHLHAHAEVGAHLPETTAFVKQKLEEFGYTPHEICESSIVATIGGKKSGKTFLLRADMDSLPITEETSCSFKATNGNMHACGHDMHATMLLGAAKILKEYEDEMKGTVKLVFQPDEEGFTGAKKMLKAGVLDNPKVDAAMALHVYSGSPTNTVINGLGTSMAGCIRFRITVLGTGCHGAMPELGVDPINIAAHIYLSLQEIISREISSTTPAILTIGKFVGGNAPNIIPNQVVMEGTIRSFSKEISDFIFKRMEEITEATAKLFRGEARLEELSSVPPLKNNTDLSNEVLTYIKDIVGEKSVLSLNEGGMGSEDFAYYSYEVPSVYFMLGAGSKTEDPLYGMPMHHPQVVFNEDILVTGAAMYAYSAMMWLKHHQ